MSSRSEEEKAINNLGKRIRAVEDALRDSHKIYKDMVQELKRIRRAAESDININVTRLPGPHTVPDEGGIGRIDER